MSHNDPMISFQPSSIYLEMSSNILREVPSYMFYECEIDSLLCKEHVMSFGDRDSHEGTSIFAEHRIKVDSQILFRNLLSHESNDQASSKFRGGRGSWEFSPTLKMHMRETVVTWMHEVCSVENCEEEVFHVSCRYLDQLVKHESGLVCKSNLQKFAAVCMLVSSKLKQSAPLSASLLSEYTDRSVRADEIRESEMLALEMLNWDLHVATPQSFLDPLVDLLSLNECNKIRQHASIFIDLSAYYGDFIDTKPSVLACASLLSSTAGLRTETKVDPVRRMCSLIGCDEDLLRGCQAALERRFAEKSLETAAFCDKVKEHKGTSENRLVGQDLLLTPRNSFKIEPSSGTPPTIADIIINDQGFA